MRDRFGVGSKKRNIAIQLILQQFYKTSCTFFCRPIYRTFSYLCSALIRRRAKRLPKSVLYNKVSLYRGSLPYILLLLGKKYRLLYRGLRYIEVRYIEVSLQFFVNIICYDTICWQNVEWENGAKRIRGNISLLVDVKCV